MEASAARVDGAKIIPTWGFRDTIRKARQTVGLDQKEFAEKIGATAGSYAGWEAGHSKPRDPVAVAKRIELLTQIPATWILGIYEETPHPDPGEGLNVRHQGLEPRTRWLSEQGSDQRVCRANRRPSLVSARAARPAAVLTGVNRVTVVGAA